MRVYSEYQQDSNANENQQNNLVMFLLGNRGPLYCIRNVGNSNSEGSVCLTLMLLVPPPPGLAETVLGYLRQHLSGQSLRLTQQVKTKVYSLLQLGPGPDTFITVWVKQVVNTIPYLLLFQKVNDPSTLVHTK